jgi:hypothetical protein
MRTRLAARLSFPFCLLLTLLLNPHGLAQAPAGPRFIVILSDGLTLDDLYEPTRPNLRRMADAGAVGLMNTAVVGPRTGTSAALTVATGMLAPAEPTDDDVYQVTEPVERATADVVFRRRTGEQVTKPPVLADGASRLVHLGIAPLVRRGLSDKTVGAAVSQVGLEGAVVAAGNADADEPRRAAGLFAVNARGIGPAGLTGTTDPHILAVWSAAQKANVVVQIGGGASALDTFLAALTPRIDLATSRLLVVSPRPPAGRNDEWDRLTLVVLSGVGVNPGLLTSRTTRTAGLIANIDVGPTLLRWLGIPVPPTMSGHLISVQPSSDPQAMLRTMDRLVTTNAHGQIPMFGVLGGIAVLAVFGGLALVAKRPRHRWLPAFGVLFLMNMPLGMLLVVLFRPASVASLLYWTVGLMLAGALFQTGLGRLAEHHSTKPEYSNKVEYSGLAECSASSILVLAILTCLVIVVDAFLGQPLVKFSVFSFYQLQGIRFYGIGNEYMAVLIGLGLLVPFLARWRAATAAVWFLTLTLVIGLPTVGANAGGLVASMTAFGCAWQIQRGKRIGPAHAAGWMAAGLAVAILVAMVERSTSAEGASHIGGALQAAGSRGYGYLLEIVWRKLQMNGRILLHPAVLAAMVCIGALGALARGPFGRPVRALVTDRPDWARSWPAFGYGALAAFLFNDSGIVAAAFIFGAFLMTGVSLFLCRTAQIGAGTGEAA